jgi:hypothetical protein
MIPKRCAIVPALVVLFAAPSPAKADPPKVFYEMSSPDVGTDWHLHAKDGALICELPCDAWLGEHTGSYLVVHDPVKSWRVDMPSDLPAPPGTRVTVTPNVGKGHPALGAFGTTTAIVGATTAFTGITMLVVTLGILLTSASPTNNNLGNFAIVGASLAVGGALIGAGGYYLADRNKSARVRFTPNGFAASF